MERRRGDSAWCPWEAILANAKALSHNAITVLLPFPPKGPF